MSVMFMLIIGGGAGFSLVLSVQHVVTVLIVGFQSWVHETLLPRPLWRFSTREGRAKIIPSVSSKFPPAYTHPNALLTFSL